MSAKLMGKTEEIVSMYVLKSQSLREIADSFGVSSGSIRTVLKKADVVLRKRGRRPTGNTTGSTVVEVSQPFNVENV